eukprot:scaffold11196_cov67-Attheya_sp.AAC.1
MSTVLVVVCKSQVPRVSRLPSSSQVASRKSLASPLFVVAHGVCVVWVGVFQCGQCGHVRCT